MHVPLDPALAREVVSRAKKQIRARMKALRAGFPQPALAARSERLVDRILATEALKNARAVASFWPMEDRGEVDLRSLDAALRARGVELYYPYMQPQPGGGHQTGFRRTACPNDLQERGQGFAEPPPDAIQAHAGDVDVVLVPALAADIRGHRIGYGAGYYDATLGDLCPPARSIIVAYQFQVLAELPVEPHDVACGAVVTDENSYAASDPAGS